MKKLIFLMLLAALISCENGKGNLPDPTGKHVIGNLPISHRDIYFCKGRIKICESAIQGDNRLKECRVGTWKMENGIIKVKYEQEYGTRGAGKQENVAAALQKYESYEDYRIKKSGETEITNWKEMNNDKDDMWRIEKHSGNCE